MLRIFLFILCTLNISLLQAQPSLIASFKVPQAQQAVAVSKDHFYVINNYKITKHRKTDGLLIDTWEAGDDLKHLNSGVVIDEKLYCSHSNFPETPMASSVEIFDINTLEHIDSHSFGIEAGSATWIDRYNGHWYVAFAHYSGNGSSKGKGPEWTQLIKYDDNWQRREAWIFPKGIIEKFIPYSTSGGAWNNQGQLLITGHDSKEIYVIELPEMGYTLKHIKTIAVPVPGQGIAWDHWEKNVLWGIDRKDNTVLKLRVE